MSTSLIASSLALVCATLCAALSFRTNAKLRIAWRPEVRRLKHTVYQDEDGQASPLTATDSTEHRFIRFLLLVLPPCGLLLSLLHATHQVAAVCLWLLSSAWFILNINGVLLVRAQVPDQRFRIGVLLSISSLALSLGVGSDLRVSSNVSAALYLDRIFQSLQLAIGICLIVASLSIPRRPEVFCDGLPVDGQYTSSAIARISYSWIQPLLKQARKLRCVEYVDLPMLDHATRSHTLRDQFVSHPTSGPKTPLWKLVFWDHRHKFYGQWTLAVFESVAMMAPLMCLYKVLSLLENFPSHTNNSSELWLWILSLTFSKLLHVGVENWLNWFCFAMLATPVRSQLSALIFAKCLRMKVIAIDSVAGQRMNAEDREPSLKANANAGDTHERSPLLPKANEEETKEGSATEDSDADGVTNGVINLLGVDVQRVADFCGYNVDLLRGAVKVTLAAAFLVVLLGWSSTLVGFAVPIIMQPVLGIATKKYTSLQLSIMAARDNKAHVVEEALHGIRQIKFSAIEAQWEKLILAARERELLAQRNVYIWGIILTFIWLTMPTMIGTAAISVYAWLSQNMKPSIAFTALSAFSSLEWTINVIPTTITEMLDAQVSINRIQQHLEAEEEISALKSGEQVELEDATVAWPSKARSPSDFSMPNLNLSFPSVSLSVIHGKTGSGKSLLLKAIIGEADVLCGEIRTPQSAPMGLRQSEHATSQNWTIPSALAYVDQVPWIENASVKSTILYGLPYRHARYQQVVHACALMDDLKMLPDGENTEIGATGINLSGGQRWRLTFARALYSRAGILVLDDIFSAVDAHVGRHLLQHGILGELGRNRTIILATHHVALVEPFASYVVHLKQDGAMPQTTTRPLETLQSLTGPTDDAYCEATNKHGHPEEGWHEAEVLDAMKPRKFVEDEARQQGKVDWSVYATYITASGGWTYWLAIFLVFGLSAVTILARSYWLAVWTDVYTNYDQVSGTPYDLQVSPTRSLLFYLSIYVAISLTSLVLVSVKTAVIIFASLRAARRLFKVMTARVLRARLRWLDTEPIGRILNRFVGDFALVDSRLGGDVTWAANGAFSLLTIIAAALYISAWMALPVLLLTITSLYVTYLYLAGARDIKRLESNAKSPMFELIGSTLAGLTTIRAFNNSENYMSHMYRHVDRYAQTTWYVLLASQWMAFRQGILGVLFTMSIASAVAYMSDIDASLAGFALSFALDFAAVSEQTIKRYTDMELAMNSAERILEYHKVPIEPDSGAEISSSWPADGRIEIAGLEVGYADDLDSVLKGIDVSIKPRQRVGIVGRTGSGKSSLMLALFRFLEARKGSIEIDGIDIAKLRLHDLRNRLTIIPQDPVLFSGTLRSNLDPFDQHPDSRLLDALRRVSLLSSDADTSGHSRTFFADLSSKVSRGGSNLSQGEKQLLCLARAILSRPKIIVLDEATSAVDMETDALIQRSIRKEFGESTLLVVAHRLSTVVDFDKILVLSAGKVAEYDSPSELARNRAAFWRMLNDSGEKDALKHLLT